MEYKNIGYSLENGIAAITLNRPEAWNALNFQVNQELIDILDKIKDQKDIRVLIITGSSKVFAAGADIREMSEADSEEIRHILEKANYINDTLEQLTIPVIAAVNGPALGGGCEMALSCDFRVAGENAFFAFPEVSLGLIPGAGGMRRAARLIGPAKAKEMVLLGRKIRGKEAYDTGLATCVVPDEQVWEEAVKMAERLKQMPDYAIAMAKSAINYGEIYGPDAGKDGEREMFLRCFSNPDRADRVNAFLRKKYEVAAHLQND